jgi:TolB-like protein
MDDKSTTIHLADDPLAGLSDRERSVAAKFAGGMTYREIGEELFIAHTTVRTHLATVYRKLNVRSKVALAALLSKHSTESGLPVHTDVGRPVIAVIPFDSIGNDERWSCLADGLSADIMIDLARYRDLAVIGRQSMLYHKARGDGVRTVGRELRADYVLEGTLQALDDRIRIAVQLVDAHTEVVLWTARYCESSEEVFAAQDRVTDTVINVLAGSCGKLASFGREVARRKPPASLGAYDLYLLGVEACHQFTPTSNSAAIGFHSKALELDSQLARAWAGLGYAHSVSAMNAYTPDTADSYRRSVACLERALELDPADSLARVFLGDLRAAQGDLERCASEHAQGLAMAPNDADTLALSAGSRTLVVGDPREGYDLAKRAIRLNPHMAWYHTMLGRSCFVLGQYRESLREFEQTSQESPSTLAFVAMVYAMLGDATQASAVAARLRNEFPEFTIDKLISGYPITNPPAVGAIRKAARRAKLA